MLLDRLPFIKRYRERRKMAVVRQYVAELGGVGFVAVLWLVAILAVLEMFIPGFAANYVSPGSLVAALAVTGGLALIGTPAPRTGRQIALYAASGALASVGAFSAAWYYFSPVPDQRAWLALAAGAATAAMFVVFKSNKEIE